MHKVLEIFSVTDLSVLPHVLVDLMEVCYRADVGFEKLAENIEKDPALCAQVLSLAGSRGLLKSGRMGSLPDLLSKLGRHAIKAIAVTSATRPPDRSGRNDSSRELISFWKHSVRCGLTSRQLANMTGYASPDEAYLAGLLHNIGQQVLASNHPQQCAALRQSAQLDTQQLLLEQEQFGIGHTDLGAELIESWGLNSFMADAARFHHQPLGYVLDAHPLVKIVYLADKLSHDESGPVDLAFDAADQLFGLARSAVADLISRAGEASGELGQSLQLRAGPDGEPESEATGLPTPGGRAAELNDRIHQIALLDGLRPISDTRTNEDSLLMALLCSAQLLTGSSRGACFLYHRPSDTFRGTNPFNSTDLISDLRVQAEPGRSLICQSLLEDRVLHSLGDDAPATTVVDRQIMGCLQSPGLLVLPLRQEQSRVGALVLGLGSSQQGRVESGMEVLEQFSADAASELLKMRARMPVQSDNDEASKAATTRTRQIVHEVNNPLSIVRNYLHVLGMKLGGDHPAREDLAVMEEELQRAVTLMKQLTDSRQRVLTQEPVAINELVSDVARVTEESARNPGQISIELNLDQQLPVLISNSDALKQILINLIRNAREALEDTGKVTIRTLDRFRADGMPFVEIVVEDDGPGIPPEIQQGLFSPMATIKGESHAGLGLSIVKNLVEEMGGSVSFDGDFENGARFCVSLPRVLADRRATDSQGERL
jgi:signal transduction histidine kinase/HD-like signal output (HDOD) protein